MVLARGTPQRRGGAGGGTAGHAICLVAALPDVHQVAHAVWRQLAHRRVNLRGCDDSPIKPSNGRYVRLIAPATLLLHELGSGELELPSTDAFSEHGCLVELLPIIAFTECGYLVELHLRRRCLVEHRHRLGAIGLRFECSQLELAQR
ncbi:hypothetical protein E2562_037822 [Oryza meyeriana var. granulata]|uniref:Uncharacterized protein n=1 Tax=Oryza meyeriana var. granulata TaxID=110450 RepID=A0A6G1C0W4_9ORYZ|nr:hypothetical protein E2562_037822 [Oryza meyeriana var. granulata]